MKTYITVILLIIIIVTVIIVTKVRLSIRSQRPWMFKKKIKHHKFGLMWYNRPYKSGETGFYQGQYLFRPVNKHIDFMINSKKEYPDELSLSFLSDLEYEYPKFESKVLSEIAKIENSTLDKIEKIGKLSVINIKQKQETNKYWEMIYWLNEPFFKDVIIEMKNFELKK